MKNKSYTEPELVLTLLETEDVIRTSAPELEDDVFPYNLKPLK